MHEEIHSSVVILIHTYLDPSNHRRSTARSDSEPRKVNLISSQSQLRESNSCELPLRSPPSFPDSHPPSQRRTIQSFCGLPVHFTEHIQSQYHSPINRLSLPHRLKRETEVWTRLPPISILSSRPRPLRAIDIFNALTRICMAHMYFD